MSEANTPFNPSDQLDSSDLTYSIWDDASNASSGEVANSTPLNGASSQPAEVDAAADWQDWQTIDFPNAISTEALAQQQLYPDNPSDQPNMADLISLIQELNQCNNILLDRVSQLEESLERSQAELQSERQRLQEQLAPAIAPTNEAIVQEQITQLTVQLEFAAQTNQRQQILIETLTTQLESSHERVAQLEREAAFVQQRYEEQSHLLTQTENACRDLQARLQRQQRYTLQFKAALEKCLEVPPPSYSAAVETVQSPDESLRQDSSMLNTQPFLPRTQRIQPWSAQDLVITEPMQADAAISASRNSEGTEPIVELPLTLKRRTDTKSSISTSSDPLEENGSDLESDTVLAQTVDAVDQDNDSFMPLLSPVPQHSDSQLESIAADSEKASATDSSLDQETAAVDLQAMLNSLATGGLSESEIVAAEDALWQDLAQLIDASTDDIIKANASESFAEFETEDLAANEWVDAAMTGDEENSDSTPADSSQGATESASQDTPSKLQSIHLPALQPVDAHAVAQTVAQPLQNGSVSQELPGALTTNPAWPSPLVYPLRPPKKRASLAAVDLPSFPR